MADPLQTINLRQDPPAGWTLVGFSPVRSDGVNPFRVPSQTTQIRFSTAAPYIMRFQLQLYSPQYNVVAQVRLDGKSLGEFHSRAGKFETVYPGALGVAGPHTLSVLQRCLTTTGAVVSDCEIHQYHAEMQFYAPAVTAALPLRQPVGYRTWKWSPNAVGTPIQVSGLSGVQFDGLNFFRTLDSLAPATITLPPGVRPTNLKYLPQTSKGAFKLHWRAGDKPLEVRSEGVEWASAGHDAVQNVPLVTPKAATQLTVQAECQGGGTDCLPIRLFATEVTGVPQENGLSSLSAPKQALSVGLTVLLLVWATWFLRPWRAHNAEG